MDNYSNFIKNLNEYYSSIAQGEVRELFDPDHEYTGQDIRDRIEKLENPAGIVVASLEHVYGYERARKMKAFKPADYYEHYKLFSDTVTAEHDVMESRYRQASDSTTASTRRS
jgi:hypothetical protein